MHLTSRALLPQYSLLTLLLCSQLFWLSIGVAGEVSVTPNPPVIPESQSLDQLMRNADERMGPSRVVF